MREPKKRDKFFEILLVFYSGGSLYDDAPNHDALAILDEQAYELPE